MSLMPHFFVIPLSLFWTHTICPCTVVNSSLWKFVKSLFLAWDIEVWSCIKLCHFCLTFSSFPCHLFGHISYAHFLDQFLFRIYFATRMTRNGRWSCSSPDSVEYCVLVFGQGCRRGLHGAIWNLDSMCRYSLRKSLWLLFVVYV